MNKKRELVNAILEKMEEAKVVLPTVEGLDLDVPYQLRCTNADRYWRQFPEGHCRQNDACIEQLLACLDEHSLEQILEKGNIPEGVQWHDLWKSWGDAGFFQCAPIILEKKGKVPILRIRHDSYLSWFRGYSFQNSYDAHANGSNGCSSSDLKLAMRCVQHYQVDDVEVVGEWEWVNAVFRKAIIMAYPMYAAGGQRYFHKMLEECPDVFDRFINLTDDTMMHVEFDHKLTLEEMKLHALKTTAKGAIVEEIVLTHEKGFSVVLRYSEDFVSLSWSECGKNRTMTILIPKWEEEVYMDQLEAIGDFNSGECPEYPDQRAYLHLCWVQLTVFLLTTAGIQFSPYFWSPVKRLAAQMDKIPVSLFPENEVVSDVRGIWDRLYARSKKYPGFKELCIQYRNRNLE